MQGPYKEAAHQLHEIPNKGSTTKQAIRAGFSEKTHSYHVNVGNWDPRASRNLPACRFSDSGAPRSDALVSLVPRSAGAPGWDLQP